MYTCLKIYLYKLDVRTLFTAQAQNMWDVDLVSPRQ